ncbi:uncharacterized protein EAF01_011586 [Botrytis porri]|uniref:Uncharacterized protein n=1 Tax=Botrytis porri TaxID=87229 RepID=A0A4Z1KC03_9HELO|nr:uncharacterized protein EAF01_011586 [Botrytis porri]KAF7884163.1 hypothetical protein EAF01_011586 [Botrytis porri]TGO83711.1 hypothetical protein BPOR_0603g00010 [Botrytis porri]
MGNCLARLEAEMVSPPPIPENWKDLGPRKALLRSPPDAQARRRCKRENGSDGYEEGNRLLLVRRETSSGIKGLTFDYAGRPVWRDPKLQMHDSDDSDIAKSEYIEETL